ncbi:MAG: RNA polymerase sigma factor, partial [Solirubrobacteraceae bacterium]
ELPPMQREAVVLAAIQGRSHHEVAGALGISDGAVRALLHRARTTLRRAAAAYAPQTLLDGLARGQGSLPTAERTGEIAAGGGTLGMAGAAVKAALLAAGAGLAVTGGVMVHATRRHPPAMHAHLAPPATGAGATRAQPASSALLAAETGGVGLSAHTVAVSSPAGGRAGERHSRGPGDRSRGGSGTWPASGHAQASPGAVRHSTDRNFALDGGEQQGDRPEAGTRGADGSTGGAGSSALSGNERGRAGRSEAVEASGSASGASGGSSAASGSASGASGGSSGASGDGGGSGQIASDSGGEARIAAAADPTSAAPSED